MLSSPADRIRDQLRSVLGVELKSTIFDVAFDGAVRNGQRPRDTLRRISFDKQFENLNLTSCEGNGLIVVETPHSNETAS